MCNLPAECDCELCEYWQENGWDLFCTPDWQVSTNRDSDEEEI